MMITQQPNGQIFVQATGGVVVPGPQQQQQQQQQAMATRIAAPKSQWNPLAKTLFWMAIPALFLAFCLGAASASPGPWMFSFSATSVTGATSPFSSGGGKWGSDKNTIYGPCSSSLTFCEPFFADNVISLSSVNGSSAIISATSSFASAGLVVCLFPLAAGFLFLVSGLCCRGHRNGNCGCCGDSCASQPASPCADSQMLRSTFVVGILSIAAGITGIISQMSYKNAATTWSTSSTGLKAFTTNSSGFAFESGVNVLAAGASFCLIASGLLLSAYFIARCNPVPNSGPQYNEAALVVAAPQQAGQGQYYSQVATQQAGGYPPMGYQPGMMAAPALGQPMMQNPYPAQQQQQQQQPMMVPQLQGQQQQQQQQAPAGGYGYPSPMAPGAFYPGPQPGVPQASPYPYPMAMPAATAPGAPPMSPGVGKTL